MRTICCAIDCAQCAMYYIGWSNCYRIQWQWTLSSIGQYAQYISSANMSEQPGLTKSFVRPPPPRAVRMSPPCNKAAFMSSSSECSVVSDSDRYWKSQNAKSFTDRPRWFGAQGGAGGEHLIERAELQLSPALKTRAIGSGSKYSLLGWSNNKSFCLQALKA